MLNETSINETEVFSTLKQKEKEIKVAYKRPSSINEIRNLEERKLSWRIFRFTEELYLGPLGNYLAILTHGEKSYDKIFKETDDLSIMERALRMREIILKNGGSLDYLLSLIPRTEEEEDILKCAKNNGFPLNHMLSNDEKVAAARQYLNTMGISPADDNIEPRTR